MIADDPFTHEDFRDRLGKLLRLLSSDQEAEAEAARRKLLQHLAHHGVSLNDLTAHLGEIHESAPAPAMDTMRDMALRAQRAEIAHRAAEQMNERLLSRLQHVRRQLLTAWILAGTLAMAIALAVAVVSGTQFLRRQDVATTVQQIAPRVSDAVRGANQSSAQTGDPALREPGEWIGTLTQPAELLDGPDSAAQRRSMLDVNARVLVLGSGPVWLHVRTEHGDGYVLKGLVRADR